MPPSSPPSTTDARGSATSGRGLAQGMVGSGLPTPVPALRPTPAPSQIPSPCALQRRDCAGNGVIVGGRVRAAAWAHELDLASKPRLLLENFLMVCGKCRCEAARSVRVPRRARPSRLLPLPSYSPTVLRSAWERMFELPPGPPPGPGRRSCLVGLLGKWAAGRQPPSATLLPLSAPSAAPPSASVGEATASSDGRFSVGMCAGVGARGHLRDRSGRTRACGHDGVRRVASGGRRGSSFARDGRISRAGGPRLGAVRRAVRYFRCP